MDIIQINCVNDSANNKLNVLMYVFASIMNSFKRQDSATGICDKRIFY